MKRIFSLLIILAFFSVALFANWFDDLNYFKGKKVEVVLASNQKTEIGVFQYTSEYMKSVLGIVLKAEDGSIIYISIGEVAVIKELK